MEQKSEKFYNINMRLFFSICLFVIVTSISFYAFQLIFMSERNGLSAVQEMVKHEKVQVQDYLQKGDSQGLVKKLSSGNYRGKGQLNIIDVSGDYLASKDVSNIYQKLDGCVTNGKWDKDSIAKALKQNKEFNFTYFNREGKECLIYISPIANTDEFMILEMPTSVLLDDNRQFIFNSIII